jgi:hypothetical protein
VKDLKIPAKLVKGQTGTHADVVTTENFEKCKLKFLCVPTSKDGSIVTNPAGNYLCHQCKFTTKPIVAFDVTDQYVSGRIETKKLKLICNPTSLAPA